MKVFVVSENPIVDFCGINETLVDTLSYPIDKSNDVIKVKEEVLKDNPDEMANRKEGDSDNNDTNSYLVTSKCPLRIFRTNFTKNSVTSSITNIVPSMSKMKRAATYFNLQFIDQRGYLLILFNMFIFLLQIFFSYIPLAMSHIKSFTQIFRFGTPTEGSKTTCPEVS
jgi:hypothetical protein